MKRTGNKNINNIQPGGFRFKLHTEDVKLCDLKVQLPLPGRLNIDKGLPTTEEAYMFTSIPLEFADPGRFFRTRIRGIDDVYIKEIVQRLAYINGFMNELSVKRMVEFMVGWMTYPSVENKKKPCITYEQLHPRVVTELQVVDYTGLVLQNKVMLFSKSTRFNSKERREWSYRARQARSILLNQDIIHNAASAAIDSTQEHLKVTNPRVLAKVDDGRIKTVRTLKAHIRKDTIDMLEHANLDRIFNQEKIVNKFIKFLQMSDKTTTDLAAELGTSRSTIVKFKELKDRNILEEPIEPYI